MKRKILIACGVAALLAVVVTYSVPSMRHNARTAITTAAARITPDPNTPFPDISTGGLSPRQVQIISLSRAEYEKHPVSYDQNVLKYTQGAKEAWCADFISWIMSRSGAPYSNPNSGSWRIPGVYTLQDYYKSQNRYVEVGGYQPKPGDVAFYIGRHTFDLFSTGHAAIVVQVTGNEMTTIGGNEGGKLRIDEQPIKRGENSLVGFGKL
jgi:CHAP domain-containing protein